MKDRRLFRRNYLLLVGALLELFMVDLHLHQDELDRIILHREMLGAFALDENHPKVNLAGTHDNQLKLLLAQLLEDVSTFSIVFWLTRPYPSAALIEVSESPFFELSINIELFVVYWQLNLSGSRHSEDASIEQWVKRCINLVDSEVSFESAPYKWLQFLLLTLESPFHVVAAW